MTRLLFLNLLFWSVPIHSIAQRGTPHCDTCRWLDLAMGLGDLSATTEWLVLLPEDEWANENAPQAAYLHQIRGFVGESNALVSTKIAKHLTQVASVKLSLSMDTLLADVAAWKQLQQISIKNASIPHLSAGVRAWQLLRSFKAKGIALAELPEEVGAWKKLEEADWSDNQLTTLPQAVGEWTALKSLNLRGNPLKELPASVGNWRKLERLVLVSKTANVILPKEIKHWKNLKWWEVDWKTFAQLDINSLKGLRRLETLVFQSIPPDELPLLLERVAVLPALKKLVFECRYNEEKLQVLASNRWKTSLEIHLKTTISDAKAVQQGTVLAQIPNLTTLELYTFERKVLPVASLQSLWDAPRLKCLATDPVILAAAGSLTPFQKSSPITDLFVVVNAGKIMPAEFQLPAFPNLEKLTVDFSRDAVIPAQLFALSPRDSLLVQGYPYYPEVIPANNWQKPSYKQLSSFPLVLSPSPATHLFLHTARQEDLSALSQESTIQHLGLSFGGNASNAYTLDLSKTAGELQKMSVSMFDETRLELVVQDSILPELEQWDVKDGTIVSNIAALPSLKRFSSIGTRWEGFTFHLPKLEVLEIRDAQLEVFPEEWIRSSALRKLDCSGNVLKQLPEQLQLLTNLRFLDVSYNQLSSVPDWVTQFPELELLVLWGNPIDPTDVNALRQKMPNTKILF